MALKRRNRVEASFSMSSMTDLIFLLLLFFVMASTMSAPNDIRIKLPQSRSQQTTRPVAIRVQITEAGEYSVAKGRSARYEAVAAENLEQYLLDMVAGDSTAYVSIHADKAATVEQLTYVLDITNQQKIKVVMATSAK